MRFMVKGGCLGLVLRVSVTLALMLLTHSHKLKSNLRNEIDMLHAACYAIEQGIQKRAKTVYWK